MSENADPAPNVDLLIHVSDDHRDLADAVVGALSQLVASTLGATIQQVDRIVLGIDALLDQIAGVEDMKSIRVSVWKERAEIFLRHDAAVALTEITPTLPPLGGLRATADGTIIDLSIPGSAGRR